MTLSKNGASYGAPAGAVTEVGNGLYKLVPSGADVTTNGDLWLHATATGALTYAGKVGTGFDNKLLAQLRPRLDAMEQSTPTVSPPTGICGAGVHWVRREIVVETSFTEWTRDGILRHPSLLGERLDKQANDVVLDRALSPDAESARWTNLANLF